MKFARGLAIVLLVFLGVTALAGSIPMILYPGGNATTLPLATLAHTPFHSYLIPGILLFVANGLLAFVVLWRVSTRSPHGWLWSSFQGVVLLVWLIAECWLLETVIWLHYLYGAVAAALILCGLAIRRANQFPRVDTQPERR